MKGKSGFFKAWSWFKFNHLELVVGMTFRFHSSGPNFEGSFLQWEKLQSNSCAKKAFCPISRMLNRELKQRHLLVLTVLFNFMAKQFDDYVEQRIEKETITKKLRKRVSPLKGDIKQLKSDVADNVRCSRRNCFLIQSVPEEQR